MDSQSPIATTPTVTIDPRITELHVWAVREGLRRAPAATVFEEFCRRLAAAGVPLWRAFVGMRTDKNARAVVREHSVRSQILEEP